jgi:hypothetical protein
MRNWIKNIVEFAVDAVTSIIVLGIFVGGILGILFFIWAVLK